MKRKQWTEVSMLSAMKVVKDGKMVSTATESFGVPITTLHDRVTGRITNKPGADPYLTTEDVELLSNYGYALDRSTTWMKLVCRLIKVVG